MKQIIFAATLAGALFLSPLVNAQSRGKHHHGKKNQQERIHDGVRKGSITRNEAMRLNMQQAKLRGYRQMAKVDGRVNGKERRLLRGEMQRADQNIYKSKHNGSFRKGQGAMAYRGQGFQGRDLRAEGNRFGQGNGNKGQGIRGGNNHYRGKGNGFHKGLGEQANKGKGYGKKGDRDATWQFRDSDKEGSWNVK